MTYISNHKLSDKINPPFSRRGLFLCKEKHPTGVSGVSSVLTEKLFLQIQFSCYYNIIFPLFMQPLIIKIRVSTDLDDFIKRGLMLSVY